MREALFRPLSASEHDIQVDIAKSIDTSEWVRRTNNGKSVPVAPSEDFMFAVPEDPQPRGRSVQSHSQSPCRSATPVKACTPVSDTSEGPPSIVRKTLGPVSKPATNKTPAVVNVAPKSPTTWSVEHILGASMNPVKYARKKIFYLIKWEGFSSTENSWESDLLPGCNDAVEEFFQTYG